MCFPSIRSVDGVGVSQSDSESIGTHSTGEAVRVRRSVRVTEGTMILRTGSPSDFALWSWASVLLPLREEDQKFGRLLRDS